MDKIKVYSPTQVAVAAFFGGPIAAVYALWKNFRTLENATAATQTLVWGSVFVVALLLVLPFLPDKFPNYAIPIAYMVTARLIANKYQLSKEAIRESDRYAFHSNWNVFGICIGFIVLFMVIAIAWFFALASAGLIKLD